MKRSLSLPRDEKVSRTILIITDGYIAAEKEVFELIQENLNQTNVFAFGIGSSVNRYLIEGMAKAGLGEPFVVTDPVEARSVARQFQEYINSPVLTNVSVQYNGFETYDIEPPSIPDLFAKRPIIVFGKWRGERQGTIELRGTSGQGEYVQTFNVSDTPSHNINSVLRYLWVRTRIGRLSDFNFNRNNPEYKSQITSLGLTYNLLTAYTSFIAVHDVVRNTEGQSKDIKQPLPLPKGVSTLAVGGACAKVPEPEFYVIMIITAMILILTFGLRKMLGAIKINK
jgi:Ca-activated chloride channel family protein